MSVFLLTAAKLQIICRILPLFCAFNVNYYDISRLFKTGSPIQKLTDTSLAKFL